MSNAQRINNLIRFGYATREKFSAHTVRVNSDVFLIGKCISFVFKQKWFTKQTEEKRNRWSQCVWILLEHQKKEEKYTYNGNHKNV